ncbi:MAG: tetratricopeptide repeat protein, partial [Pseudomonadales bacterium]|nr:tetratricopeptide repeat protein [Pseudomonadales bacterium]
MPSTFLQEVRRRNVLKVAAAYAVAGWLLLQVADVTFPAFGLDDGDIAYVLVAVFIGLPLVVAFSWFYEITPDGLVPTRRVSPNQSISRETGRRINHIIIGLLSVALIFFMFEYFSREQVPIVSEQAQDAPQQEAVEAAGSPVSEAGPSIAVMPFVNMSSDKENEYFSDGLSEELLNVLAQIKGLQVAGRTSSFYYKGRNEDLRDIGRELNVNNILEGSVRKAGNKVRITAQLISAHDGFHLWSDTYDRELTDIFGIQEEISRKVAQALQLTLLTDEVRLPDNRQTENSEAHDAYLQARQLLYDRRPESILRSIDLFRLATQLDPEYGPPWVGLASANMIAWNNHRSIDLGTAMDTASKAYATAESLGYLSSDYWASRGLYYDHLVYLDPENYQRSREAFERALELNPNNPDVLHWYAITLRDHEPIAKLGRERELISRAIAVDPHNRVIKMNYYLSMMGTPDEARGVEALARLAREDAGFDGYLNYLSSIHFSRGRFAEAAEIITQMSASNPQRYSLMMPLAMLYGGVEKAREVLDSVPADNQANHMAHLLH